MHARHNFVKHIFSICIAIYELFLVVMLSIQYVAYELQSGFLVDLKATLYVYPCTLAMALM